MSIFLEPKFCVGQTVYWPDYTHTKEVKDCPDCLGAAKWKVITPAGTEFEVPCERCARWDRDIPKHEITVVVPKVNSMTITAIKAQTGCEYGSKGEASICYTANGHYWEEEDKFFVTQEEAEIAAKKKAADEQARLLETDLGEQKCRYLAGYTIVNALAKELKEKERDAHYKYERAIDRIKELPDDYVSGFGCYMRSGSSMDTPALRCVAAHLLDELKEEHPEEWGCS